MRAGAAMLAAALVLTGVPAPVARAGSPLAEARIAEARSDCEAYAGGVFSIEGTAVTEVDLTGDGVADELIDARRFRCSSVAGSLWCGTGGCGLTVVAGESVTELLVKDWRIVEWHDRSILLTAIHGSECGGTNLRWCYEALVWSEGGLRSVSAWRQAQESAGR